MPLLEVDSLSKVFGATRAIDNISFGVEACEILVIVGGSGCGKTTTLRCIAGLEDPTSGTISLDGRVISSAGESVSPEARGIGMVFQSYALWPHMNVYQNVAYGLERKRIPAEKQRELVESVLKQVGLAGFSDRYPATLSGGQQQRVALARSAVVKPKLLLLDEPLSNLDAKLREQMRDELRDMIKMFAMTAIHITHDQAEAMALADQIICMRSGRIEQKGSAREIYRTPANRFVADFIGAGSFLDGKIVGASQADGMVPVRISDDFEISARDMSGRDVGSPVLVVIRPEAIALSEVAPGERNVFPATILRAIFLGSHSEYLVDIRGVRLKAHSMLDLSVGARCFVAIDPQRAACMTDQ
jgi:ABC-type Fe3+/spermidine/putrescine transport system ATPase subunit